MASHAHESTYAVFWNGLLTQQAVLRALVLRELQIRFGRHNIGYLWMIVEPMMLATAITLIHMAAERGAHSTGMGPFPFTLLGYCLIMIFRNSFTRADGAINGAASLMYHAQVKPFDVMLSKMIVEVVGALSALLILMSAGIMIGLAEPPVRPLYVFGGILAISVWTFGLALMVATFSYENPIVGRFVQPIAYFMFPLSGAFITMDFLPVWAREYMAWNPLMAMFEMARYGYFYSATDRYIYTEYILAHCAMSFLLGLIAIRWLRSRIHV